jgi:hypothetical protein
MVINQFIGLHTKENPRSIPDNALASAIDVDLSDAGVLTQRPGYALTKSISNITSAYTTFEGESYLVAGGFLYRVLSDLNLANLGACSASSFADDKNVLYTNDGIRVIGNEVRSLSFTFPRFPPVLTATTGSLPAGWYSATYTFVSPSGLESSSAPVESLKLLAPGGIAISTDTPANGYTVRTYLTEAGGTVYQDASGMPLGTEQAQSSSPFPENSEQIAWYDSSLYAGQCLDDKRSIVYWSQSLHPHLFARDSDYFIVQGQLRALMPTLQGLVVATSDAIYVFAEGVLTPLAGYGCSSGRPIARLPDGSVRIFSARGICAFPPFENLTEKKCSFPAGGNVSTAIVESDGIQRFIALSDSQGPTWNIKT